MTKGLEQMTYKILTQSLPWASSTAPQETPSSPHLAWAFPLKPSPTAAALCIPLSPHSPPSCHPAGLGTSTWQGPAAPLSIIHVPTQEWARDRGSAC